MLIALCLFFPPALPFVLLFYIFGNRGANRRSAKAQQRIAAVAERAEYRALSAVEKHSADVAAGFKLIFTVALFVGIFMLVRHVGNVLFPD